MHEIGMCASIIDAVQRRAAGRRVTGVRVRIGARHGVAEEHLHRAFALVADGTVAEGADVDVVVTPLVLSCRSCGQRSESLDPLGTCAGCGSGNVEATGGDEFVLESVRLEAPA